MPDHQRRLHCGAALALALIPFIAVCDLAAQETGSIAGVVTDAITRAPIPNAVVTVMGSSLNAQTDADGLYVIDSVMPGLVKVRTQVVGFHPITTSYYTVLPNETVDVSFNLAPVIFNVEGVEVTGTTPAREWPSVVGARVLTKKDLPERGSILTALQGVVPSIRVVGRREDQRLVVRNAEADMLYVVDNVVIRPPLTFYIDVADVVCVEIRRGFRAVMEFKPSIVGPNYSGVLLIWTKGTIGPRPKQCIGGG